jgi:hypothetical protein
MFLSQIEPFPSI